jgi:diguanylate cyclase (GGDEF)-like protein/PAS domain S-box-containing protein
VAAAKDSDRQFEFIVNRSPDFITLINSDYVYEFANDAYCLAVDRSRDEVVGKSVADIWGQAKFETSLRSVIDRCLDGETVEYIDAFRFGSFERHMHVCYYPYSGETGESDGTRCALVFSHDITRLTEIETRLTRYEYVDPLTGLLNRRSLSVVLDKEIYKAQRAAGDIYHALVFISLREFAAIHQSYGPDFADILLENTGLRVKSVVRDSDYVFRFDGTDLTVLLTNITQAADAAIVAEKIHEAITVPYSYKGIEARVESTIGVSIFPTDGSDSQTLIHHANSAIVEANRLQAPYLLYDADLHEKAIARIALKSELQRAFESRQFILHYQPFVDRNGAICGAEALIRWNHPDRGLLYPGAFIGLAEETRLISAIDKWALFEVCRELLRFKNVPGFFISINISARDLLDQFLIEVVEQALGTAGDLAPSMLKLELTERISMDDPEKSIQTMETLMAMGVEVWIDDFGTGQSSLSYLKQLPAVVLKIDRVFIEQIADNPEDQQYLESIVTAIRSRGKRVIIEGVSTPEQARQLESVEFEYLQGFHFSKGIIAEDLLTMVENGVRLPAPDNKPGPAE